MSKAKNTSVLNEISERTEKARENVPKVSHPGQLSAKIKGIKQLSQYSIHDKQVLELPG